jgi:hypothetical protein
MITPMGKPAITKMVCTNTTRFVLLEVGIESPQVTSCLKSRELARIASLQVSLPSGGTYPAVVLDVTRGS